MLVPVPKESPSCAGEPGLLPNQTPPCSQAAYNDVGDLAPLALEDPNTGPSHLHSRVGALSGHQGDVLASVRVPPETLPCLLTVPGHPQALAYGTSTHSGGINHIQQSCQEDDSINSPFHSFLLPQVPLSPVSLGDPVLASSYLLSQGFSCLAFLQQGPTEQTCNT